VALRPRLSPGVPLSEGGTVGDTPYSGGVKSGPDHSLEADAGDRSGLNRLLWCRPRTWSA
jgi:hypothetical protein